MPLSEATYRAVVFEDDDTTWELHRGRLRAKPLAGVIHNRAMNDLAFALHRQLPERDFEVRVNAGRLRRREDRYHLTILVPDAFVFPAALADELLGRPDLLEIYDVPVPLVIEVWAPVNDPFDVITDKRRTEEYRRRGDQEVWLLRPDDRTLTIWRRQADGSYAEEVVTGGVVRPAFLPNVTIDLDELFARL